MKCATCGQPVGEGYRLLHMKTFFQATCAECLRKEAEEASKNRRRDALAFKLLLLASVLLNLAISWWRK